MTIRELILSEEINNMFKPMLECFLHLSDNFDYILRSNNYIPNEDTFRIKETFTKKKLALLEQNAVILEQEVFIYCFVM